uniref:Uncharacterized protein n=1 Tax=Candidatus Kentrum sp. LFY TaxID=2126342 RepID=A0A450VB53_9GAMM|nr:MAG: hypothetical protein BECKLFY1418A_GA0070994_11732 [Candidatus Kentron sp. LFY]
MLWLKVVVAAKVAAEVVVAKVAAVVEKGAEEVPPLITDQAGTGQAHPGINRVVIAVMHHQKVGNSPVVFISSARAQALAWAYQVSEAGISRTGGWPSRHLKASETMRSQAMKKHFLS